MAPSHEPHDPAPGRDPGLAAERTDIAWARSGLAILTCLAAVLKRVPSMGVGERYGIVSVFAMAVVSIAAVTWRRPHAAVGPLPVIDATALRLARVARNATAVALLCFAVVLAALA